MPSNFHLCTQFELLLHRSALPHGRTPIAVRPTSKLVASGLCRLLSGFPLFSEANQVAYSNPERTLSRKRPPRCPSSKPSSMGGRSRKNDIIDHPASLTLPPGGFTAAIANSKPTPGRVGIQDFGPSALIHRSVSRTSSHCRTPLVAARYAQAFRSKPSGYRSLRNSATLSNALTHKLSVSLAIRCTFRRHAVSVARFCTKGAFEWKCM